MNTKHLIDNEDFRYAEYIERGNSSEDSNEEFDERQVLVIDEIRDSLNDITDDNGDTFGLSFYDDLVDTSSLGIGQINGSNMVKSIEDQVTIKSKIENSLGLYRVEIKDKFCDKFKEFDLIKDIKIGFSNDIIGTGDLSLKSMVGTKEAYFLCWDGFLIECFLEVGADLSKGISGMDDENSKGYNTSSSYFTTNNDNFSLGLKNRVIYSFPLEYIIDVNLKQIEENYLIFVKSDFKLKNETIFIQFSFSSNIEAKYWFDIINKYKALQTKINKKLASEDSDDMMAEKNTESDELKDIKTKDLCTNLEQGIRDNSTINSSKDDVRYERFELSQEEKKYIEDTIKNLVFKDLEVRSIHLGTVQPRSHLEYRKLMIKQKCSFIARIVDCINNDPSDSISDLNDTFTCPICCETFECKYIIILNPCGHRICTYCESKLVDSVCPWDRSNYEIQNHLHIFGDQHNKEKTLF